MKTFYIFLHAIVVHGHENTVTYYMRYSFVENGGVMEVHLSQD